ncbi:MAG: TIGR03943 family protein [Gordonia sp. (in: high G+C Gram-positive bacteria)]|uniref:TIGR03943 family putative permease subunit n=1 Tax=Gordonia sp. (in: high G+C Gram-positive bacteria) TaxID=84139 RepID=UPI0039E391AB
MNSEVQNLSLLCIGLAIVRITLDGSFVRYVKPSLEPYLLISGTVLVALALLAIVRDIRAGGPADRRDEHACDHGHRHDGKVLWLLAVPVLVVFFLRPPALVPAAEPAPTNVTVAESSMFDPLPDEPAPPLDIYEIVQRAAQPDGGGLNGRAITVTGSLQHRGKELDLAQVRIICCVADGRTFRMGMSGAAAQRLAESPQGSWWKVIGTVVPGSANAERDYIPLLEVGDARSVPEPENPYGY